MHCRTVDDHDSSRQRVLPCDIDEKAASSAAIPSHQRALLRSLASALFLTERDAEFDDNAPKVKGRIITTIDKAKEVRPLVEKCITIACRGLAAEEAAARVRHHCRARQRRLEDVAQERQAGAKWNAADRPGRGRPPPRA